MYSSQNNLSKDVVDDLKQILKTTFTINGNEDDFIVIPRNVKLAESPSFGKPIIFMILNHQVLLLIKIWRILY